MELLVSLMPGLGALLALLFAALGLHNNSRKRLVQSLPTSRSDGVFIGLVELQGTVESAEPLRSHLAEVPCVLYSWSVEEEWRRTVVSTDNKGRPRVRQEQGWNTVASGAESQPFYLKDDSGAVLVRPEKAKLHPAALMEHDCGPDDPLYYAKGPAESISNSTHRRRFTEHGFAVHAPVYVIGRARERSDAVAPEIAHDKAAEVFIISTRGEQKVVSGYRAAAIALSIVGLIVLLGLLVWWDYLQGRHWQARTGFYALAALGYAGAWALGWAWSVYNGLITLRNRVAQGWSLIDVQLQRRHDLIPNLVRIAEALKGHEQRVQATLATLRAQAAATLPGQAGPDPQAIAPALTGLREDYPELGANDAFLGLQKELATTENRIALARDYFNSIATHYNTRLGEVPDRFVAALAGLKPQALLAAADFQREAIQVDFAG